MCGDDTGESGSVKWDEGVLWSTLLVPLLNVGKTLKCKTLIRRVPVPGRDLTNLTTDKGVYVKICGSEAVGASMGSSGTDITGFGAIDNCGQNKIFFFG